MLQFSLTPGEHMIKKLTFVFLSFLLVLPGLFLSQTKPAYAFAPPTGSYQYKSDDFDVITDVEGNEYEAIGFGCDRFNPDTRKPSGANGARCPDGGFADHYWMHEDDAGISLVVVPQEQANEQGRPAKSGVQFGWYFAWPEGRDSIDPVEVNIAPPADGLSYTDLHEPYRYVSETDFEQIVDTRNNIYQGAGFGCGLDGKGKIKSPGSETCGSRPADYYWLNQHEDGGKSYIVIPGEAVASTSGVDSANSGEIFGDAAVFAAYTDSEELAVSKTGVTISEALAPAGVGAGLDFEGSCRQEAGTLSWILCPVINLTNTVFAGISEFILGLLSLDPLTPAGVSENNDNEYIYNAWEQFRNIANFLLVLVFLIIIYMQVFSSNNAYVVYRIIPRLVVAVIAMQLSFFIGAIIVDIGNVLANGIAGIFNFINQGIMRDAPVHEYYSSGSIQGDSYGSFQDFLTGNPVGRGVGSLFGIGIAVVGITVGLAVIGFSTLGVFLFSALLAVITAFAALAFRQLAIFILIVLSPFAILAAVIPNTEKYFNSWLENLTKLVMIYPIVALLFGASSTLSLIALGGGSNGIKSFNNILAAALPVIVMFAIPALFGFAGGALKAIIGAVSNAKQKAGDSVLGDRSNPFSLRNRARTKRMDNLSSIIRGERGVAPMRTTARAVNRSRLGQFLWATKKHEDVLNDGRERAKAYLSNPDKNFLRVTTGQLGGTPIGEPDDPNAQIRGIGFGRYAKFSQRSARDDEIQEIRRIRQDFPLWNGLIEAHADIEGSNIFRSRAMLGGFREVFESRDQPLQKVIESYDYFAKKNKGRSIIWDSVQGRVVDEQGRYVIDATTGQPQWSEKYAWTEPHNNWETLGPDGYPVMGPSVSTNKATLIKHTVNMHDIKDSAQTQTQTDWRALIAAVRSPEIIAEEEARLKDLAKIARMAVTGAVPRGMQESMAEMDDYTGGYRLSASDEQVLKKFYNEAADAGLVDPSTRFSGV